ncbi:MAG: hypothetical protein AAFP23_03070 [Pseudomonadota bacterium]
MGPASVFGMIVGGMASPLIVFTNRHYEASETMAPFVLGSVLMMAWMALSLLLGLLLWAFGRRGIIRHFAGMILGLGLIGGIDAAMDGALVDRVAALAGH